MTVKRHVLSGVLLTVAMLSASCSKKPDTIVETVDSNRITAEQIDRDPLALLPGGAIGIIRVDAAAYFQSQFGQRLRTLVEARSPIPTSSGFDPARDLVVLYIGLYSMQGADFAMIAKGRFQPAAIEQAAASTQQTTALGAPIVTTTYAKRTLYLSRNVGFVVLTPQTVLLGNETGIRRALDRLDEGRAKHDVPAWMDSVLDTPGAAIAAGFDFQGQAIAAAAVKSVSFLNGVRTARAIGNFQPPGMNVAGSLTYADPQAAASAVSGLLGLHQQLKNYSFFMSLAGIQNPIQKLEAKPEGNDAQFVAGLEASGVEWLLARLAEQLGSPGGTVPATTTPTTPATTSQPRAYP